MKQAKTIDEAIDILSKIVIKSRETNSAMGFFAALYRKVTIRIKEGIALGEFEDNPRMEVLDVIFANRYIMAHEQYSNGITPTQSWAIAFAATKENKCLILQHLLLGINAHINLDLGIAAVETTGKGNLSDLKNDFDKINDLLADMVEDVQLKIAKVSPLIGMLDKVAGNRDERLTNFSIKTARIGAWEFATKLYTSRLGDRTFIIKERDLRIAALAHQLARPNNRWMRSLIKLIYVFEIKKVSKAIGILM